MSSSTWPRPLQELVEGADRRGWEVLTEPDALWLTCRRHGGDHFYAVDTSSPWPDYRSDNALRYLAGETCWDDEE